MDFHHTFEQLQDGDIEGATAKVQYQHPSFLLALLQAIGQRGGGGFVDQALDPDASQFAGGAGGLALGVGKIRRHADDRFFHFLPEHGFRIGQQ